MEKKDVTIIDRGLIDLNDYLKQKEFIIPSIELLEHNTVITLGKSGKLENIINLSYIREHKIPIIEIDRGGDVTLHSPGQLIIYPHYNIKHIKIKDFISKFVNIIVGFFKEYGINTFYDEDRPGIWIKDRKICSIGISVKKYITYFGFALYINPDLSLFSIINPCGFSNIEITSLQHEINTHLKFEEVKNKFKEYLYRNI